MAAVADEIEPDAKALIGDGADDALVAAASVAISLRRIADVLTGGGEQAALFGMMQNLMWEAGRSFQAGLRTDR